MKIYTVFRIYASLQPGKRKKWVGYTEDFDDQGTTELTEQEAHVRARVMQTELEEMYPDWTQGAFGVESSNYWTR